MTFVTVTLDGAWKCMSVEWTLRTARLETMNVQRKGEWIRRQND